MQTRIPAASASSGSQTQLRPRSQEARYQRRQRPYGGAGPARAPHRPHVVVDSASSNGLHSQSSATTNGAVDPRLLDLMQRVAAGALPPQAAAYELRDTASGSIEEFHLDAGRAARTGFPEVVWGPGKSPEQIAAIMRRLLESEAVVMATRITPEVHQAVRELVPEVQYNALARVLLLKSAHGRKQPRMAGTVAILSEGTADGAVAEECRLTAEAMGCYCFRLLDVGVAGLQRMLTNLPAVRAANVVVVVAGMDGALPTVVAGLVEAPVIAVPTSIGYGAAFGGVSALLAGLTSSSPGVTVVNIDNGFGAGMAAARILRAANKLRRAGAGAADTGAGAAAAANS